MLRAALVGTAGMSCWRLVVPPVNKPSLLFKIVCMPPLYPSACWHASVHQSAGSFFP